MQTFLPLPDFEQTAKVLDYKRLWKQCVECKQIYNSLVHGGGWQHHPAVKMWRGHEYNLLIYATKMCSESYERGIQSGPLWHEFYMNLMGHAPTPDPLWLGNADFHAAHRSNLLRKAPDHYGQFNWQEPNDLPYVWPL